MENRVETKCNFKLGQFKIVTKMEETEVEQLIEPLNQNDYAEGWRMVLPNVHKTSTRHHFNVSLANLPPHLWSKIRYDVKCNYLPIMDNIYQYTVKKHDSDEDLFELYHLVNNPDPNYNWDKLDLVQELYNSLQKENVKGWIMTRAKSLLSK